MNKEEEGTWETTEQIEKRIQRQIQEAFPASDGVHDETNTDQGNRLMRRKFARAKSLTDGVEFRQGNVLTPRMERDRKVEEWLGEHRVEDYEPTNLRSIDLLRRDKVSKKREITPTSDEPKRIFHNTLSYKATLSGDIECGVYFDEKFKNRRAEHVSGRENEDRERIMDQKRRDRRRSSKMIFNNGVKNYKLPLGDKRDADQVKATIIDQLLEEENRRRIVNQRKKHEKETFLKNQRKREMVELSLGTMHDSSLSHEDAAKIRWVSNAMRESAFLKTNATFHYYQYSDLYHFDDSERDEIEEAEEFIEGSSNYENPLLFSTRSSILSSMRENQQATSQRFFTSTQRSYSHPNFESTRSQYIQNNQDRFKLVQIHRKEQLDNLQRAKMRRKELQRLSGQLPSRFHHERKSPSFSNEAKYEEIMLSRKDIEQFEQSGAGLKQPKP